MKDSLPSLKNSDKELEEIYEKQSRKYLDWMEKNSISPNSSKDIAMLAHNELVKRSNDRFARKSVILTISVIFLSIITLSFAFLDFWGDKKWQKKQIEQLELISNQLIEQKSLYDTLLNEREESSTIDSTLIR